jgi:hypothetical protein
VGALLMRMWLPVRFRKYRARQDEVEIQFKSPAAAEEFLARAIERMQGQLAASISPAGTATRDVLK